MSSWNRTGAKKKKSEIYISGEEGERKRSERWIFDQTEAQTPTANL